MKTRHGSGRDRWLAGGWVVLLVAGLLAIDGGDAGADEPAAGAATTADEPGAAARAEAKAHNAAATKLFNLGDFAGAAARYHQAYAAVQTPVFLYNLAQCYRRMPRLEHQQKALFFYKSFLQNTSDPSARDELEGEIAAVRQRVAELERERERARAERRPAAGATTEPARRDLVIVRTEPAQPEERAPAPYYHKWWFWTIVGAAVAGATSAIVVAAWPDPAAAHQGSLYPGQIQIP